jgi:hypothetical protein
MLPFECNLLPFFVGASSRRCCYRGLDGLGDPDPKARGPSETLHEGQIEGGGGDGGEPAGAHQAGRHWAGPMFPGMPGKEAEGARCCAARSLPVWMSIVEGRHGTRRFITCTDSAAKARSTVEALTFRAVTRTLLFNQTWQSSTKAMLLPPCALRHTLAAARNSAST